MGSMVISSRFKKIVLFLVRIHLVFFISEQALYAKNWLILPSFTSSEIYTDNYLLSNQKKALSLVSSVQVYQLQIRLIGLMLI